MQIRYGTKLIVRMQREWYVFHARQQNLTFINVHIISTACVKHERIPNCSKFFQWRSPSIIKAGEHDLSSKMGERSIKPVL